MLAQCIKRHVGKSLSASAQVRCSHMCSGRLMTAAKGHPALGRAVQHSRANRMAPYSFGQTAALTELNTAQRLAILQALQTVDRAELASKKDLKGPLTELKAELEKHGAKISEGGAIATPGPIDLVLWALLHGTPFVVFGVLDNALMLMTADYINTSMGVTVGLSTMFACAIGNIVGDVFGIFSSNPIERLVIWVSALLRLPMPKLTDAQKVLPISMFFKTTGCVVGVTIGLFIGMFPLVWIQGYEPTKQQLLGVARHVGLAKSE